MITLLIVLASILGYFLIGHIVWRIGLKIAFDEASDMVFMSHFLWFFSFIHFLIEADLEPPKLFQRIIDKNDVRLQANLKRDAALAAKRKALEAREDITRREIDLGMELSYPELAPRNYRSSNPAIREYIR